MSKAGSKWDEKEVNDLLDKVENGDSWLSISENHKRSIVSVQMKAISEILKTYDEKDEKEMVKEISEKFGVSEDMVLSIYSKEKEKKGKEVKNEKNIAKKNKKYSTDSYKMLWDFKLFYLEKVKGNKDNTIHSIFDDFVKLNINV